MATLKDGIIIKGITQQGKPFRPSDWAERLCGVMRCFERDTVGYNHITTHNMFVLRSGKVLKA